MKKIEGDWPKPNVTWTWVKMAVIPYAVYRDMFPEDTYDYLAEFKQQHRSSIRSKLNFNILVGGPGRVAEAFEGLAVDGRGI